MVLVAARKVADSVWLTSRAGTDGLNMAARGSCKPMTHHEQLTHVCTPREQRSTNCQAP